MKPPAFEKIRHRDQLGVAVGNIGFVLGILVQQTGETGFHPAADVGLRGIDAENLQCLRYAFQRVHVGERPKRLDLGEQRLGEIGFTQQEQGAERGAARRVTVRFRHPRKTLEITAADRLTLPVARGDPAVFTHRLGGISVVALKEQPWQGIAGERGHRGGCLGLTRLAGRLGGCGRIALRAQERQAPECAIAPGEVFRALKFPIQCAMAAVEFRQREQAAAVRRREFEILACARGIAHEQALAGGPLGHRFHGRL